jgi:hypothetical protein
LRAWHFYSAGRCSMDNSVDPAWYTPPPPVPRRCLRRRPHWF